MTHSKALIFSVAVMGLLASAAGHAQVASPTEAEAKVWATACMACHGHNGKAEGVGFLLGGRPASELFDQLVVFRSGKRSGTMMPYIVKGFSNDELKLIVQEFAAFK